ncbi:hypothetical protein AM571_PC01333 (plasmid) [Rhizobium etli 8C-3]|uniref:Antitoxin VbhA domain-containing protein n=2 Tax=Rhizobium TaxID=379 RepID=A0A4R3R548_9HYPH|nr:MULTISPECIES: hypothetical protein [Rhizobium]APO79065.1 hypothetical protein AM571_PC01333 [Rhizobium etli 8C-3]TCU29037.1 hypothetical protein EV130_102217 [Rhizobium azibense]TCU31593.1 hypothetical protein EV129_12655 [Rhizobium azibense]
MSIKSRRLAVNKAFGRARRLGLEIDADPAFHALIECWVTGELTMPQVRERYLALLKERAQFNRERSSHPDPAAPEGGAKPSTAEVEPGEESSLQRVRKRRRTRKSE